MTCCAVSHKSCKRGSLLSVAHEDLLLRNSPIGTTDRLVIFFQSTAYKLPFTIHCWVSVCWVQNCSCCMSTDLTSINGTEMVFSPVFWWRLVQTLGCIWIHVCSLSVHVLMTAHFCLHVFGVAVSHSSFRLIDCLMSLTFSTFPSSLSYPLIAQMDYFVQVKQLNEKRRKLKKIYSSDV